MGSCKHHENNGAQLDEPAGVYDTIWIILNGGNTSMTIIVTQRFLTTIAIIADCRVSYPPPYDEKDDYLQKIYQIDDRLVLGFSGPLQGAYEVLELVKENISEYSRPPVAHNLLKDVTRWIKYKYRQLDEIERKDLGFMLVTTEPHRERSSKWQRQELDGKKTPIPKPLWFPYVPEWKTLALVPSKSKPGELVPIRKPHPLILGLKGKEHREVVRRVFERKYGFAHNQPELQMQVIMNTLKLKLMAEQVKTVGGLFQCALLSKEGIHWIGYRGGSVALQFEKGRFVQRNIVTEKKLPLLSIWEWAEKKPPPGSFGTFEDLDLLRVIEENTK